MRKALLVIGVASLLAVGAVVWAQERKDREDTPKVTERAHKTELSVGPDGAVKLSVSEKVGPGSEWKTQTYEAKSLAEFKERYPEIALKHLDGAWTGEYPGPGVSDEIDRELDQLRQRFLDDPWFHRFGGYDRWIDRLWPDPGVGGVEKAEIPGKNFGVSFDVVDDALAAQLGLEKGEGILIYKVTENSLAARSGVQPFDVVTKVNSGPVRGPGEFREAIRSALGSPEFKLELIRKGKAMILEVRPGGGDEGSGRL